MKRSKQNVLGLSLKDTAIVIVNEADRMGRLLRDTFTEPDFSELYEQIENNNIELMEQIVFLSDKAVDDVNAALDGKEFDHISYRTLKILREVYFYEVLATADLYNVGYASGHTEDLDKGMIGIDDFLIDDKTYDL